jgi:hypothetical protein
MPQVAVYVGRIDIGTSSGMIYSYEPIDDVAQGNIRILKVCQINIATPLGYDLEEVQSPCPYGDIGPDRLVFDPAETARGKSGRVYMRAARLVERMRQEPHLFAQVGPGVPY